MAEVFNSAMGMPLEKVIALTREAQDATREVATDRGKVADAILKAGPYSEGDSKIIVESGLADVGYGEIDWFIILDDSAGLDAALSIEYGRNDKGGKGGMAPVAPLHKAVPEAFAGGG